MSRIACDFFGFQVADGPTNMALDDALLANAACGIASFRLYSWQAATLSLGYFQRAAERPPGLPFVRRSTGGGAIIHHHDLTYALALPVDVYRATERPWVCRMHDAIRAALTPSGVGGLSCASVEAGRGSFLCFEHHTVGDVLIGTHKVVGSAQRKRIGSVLIHGSVLLGASPHAPQLPGVRELSGTELKAHVVADAIGAALLQTTDWRVWHRDWDGKLRDDVSMARATYASDEWNLKR